MIKFKTEYVKINNIIFLFYITSITLWKDVRKYREVDIIILLVAIIIATCLRTTRPQYRIEYNIPYSRRDPNDNNKYIYNTNNIMYSSRATIRRTWNRSIERFRQKSVS